MPLLKDKPGLAPVKNASYLQDTFYGFKPSVAKANKMMYVCLAATCVVGISQQTFFSYLINFIVETLGFGDGFIIPMAVIIVGAAVVAGVMGFLYDKVGRKHFFVPLLAVLIVSTLALYLIKFAEGTVRVAVAYVAGVLMMGSVLSLSSALNASFQDYIPTGYEGRFQGVRMCFTVLIPMIVGPLISMGIGLDAMGMNGDSFKPPFEIFLAASIVAVLAFVPIFFVRKDATRLRESLLAKKAEEEPPKVQAEVAKETE
jgi:MFS family permease